MDREKLTESIEREALKLITRHELYARDLFAESQRRIKRSTSEIAALTVLRPGYWDAAPGFNPFLVRARRKRIAHSITAAWRDGTYSPHNPIRYQITKPNGQARELSVFQVADNVVSRMLLTSLRSKNRSLLSARAYAYRDDLTVHDAVQHIAGEFRHHSRMYIAEFDFTDYFGSIGHDHILRALEDDGYLVTTRERAALLAFMRAVPQDSQSYLGSGTQPNTAGIPQGTSISLFLANVAAARLDRQLERLGVGFARYADDTLIWSPEYAKVTDAAGLIHIAAKEMGVTINQVKSEGVRLLRLPNAKGEIRNTTHVEYVGHRVSLTDVGMKRATVLRLKKHIGALAYFNLLNEARAGTQQFGRLGDVDWDYVIFIDQLRQYMYGDLTEHQLRKFNNGGIRLRRFKGLMSFYPLVSDKEQLTTLDAWVRDLCWQSLRRRAVELTHFPVVLPAPHGYSPDELAAFIYKSNGKMYDLRIPSFLRIASAIEAAVAIYGANAVASGDPYGY